MFLELRHRINFIINKIVRGRSTGGNQKVIKGRLEVIKGRLEVIEGRLEVIKGRLEVIKVRLEGN